MRRPLVLGNWKMELGLAAARGLARDLGRGLAGLAPVAEVGVCPSHVHLGEVGRLLEGSVARLGAQDLAAPPPGAFTGGTSAEQLRELGVHHVLVGHSERRQHFGEPAALMAQKLAAALRAGLSPVLCVGETLDDREAGRTRETVASQLAAALDPLDDDALGRVVVAYEPVWAIGTGRNASPADAVEVHRQVRETFAARGGRELGDSLRVLYGGSVKPANAASYFAEADIDGALVGGASLAADSFLAILGAARG